MSKGDYGTRLEETEDLFPVRDIETDTAELVTPRNKTKEKFQSPRNNSQEAIDLSLNFEGSSLSETGEKIFIMSQMWYLKTCNEVSKAIHDVQNTWTVTTGKHSEKMKVTSRLVMYYLIILSLYIIKSSFWVDRKLLNGLYRMVLNSKQNTQMLIGLGIVLSLIVLAYVIGAPCPEPRAMCDK